MPITELELATMAYVLCAVLMYAFWWHKPFGVEQITVIECKNEVKRGAVTHKWKRRHTLNNALFMLYDSRDSNLPVYIFYLITTAFSGVHFVAWNWTFPSIFARNLWRAFGIGATAAGTMPKQLNCEELSS